MRNTRFRAAAFFRFLLNPLHYIILEPKVFTEILGF